MPSDRSAKRRVPIAFFFLFVFMVIFSVGAYLMPELGRRQQDVAAREGQTVLQGVAGPGQIDEALKQNPPNKFLQMVAMATRAANETDAAGDKLSVEIEPPAVAGANNLGAASRSDLEALRRDLKTAEANATAFMPRYIALLKTERDNVEKYALSLRAGKDTVGRLLDNLDRRHAEITMLTSALLSARAAFCRAYENYVAILIGEFGAYKVVNGQFIFPFQRTVDRYNVAANAMTIASRRVAELEENRKTLLKAQQQGWEPLVSSGK